ncbi:MAG: STAS domain-containing protein [Bacteroidota bacterium]
MRIHSVDIGDSRIAIIEMGRDLLGGLESREVRSAVEELSSKGNHNLILDFTGSVHINSMGLGVLSSAYITYTKLGGKIALCNCGPHIRALLGLTKMGSLFELCGSRGDAIQFLSKATR